MFAQLRAQNARENADKPPTEHLKKCPHSLTEIYVGDESRQHAADETRVRAQRHAGDYDYRGARFETRERGENNAADDRKSREHRRYRDEPRALAASGLDKADQQENRAD